jgi:hypothetical protein
VMESRIEEDQQGGRGQEGTGVFWDFIHVAQGIVALAFLWDFTLHAVNEVSTLLTGSATVLPMIGALGLGVSITCGWFCDVILVCIVTGVITYAVFKLVCWTEWVQEEISWRECWNEFRWYNPWSWVKTLVCVTKTALQWVLKQICKWIETIVVVLVITCILATILIALL